MTAKQNRKPASSIRRYLVHLLHAAEGTSGTSRYVVRIRPWAARSASTHAHQERIFEDECELIATINPLLPDGSDVRDVFEHIESPSGFFYLLRLSHEEAEQLGWR